MFKRRNSQRCPGHRRLWHFKPSWSGKEVCNSSMIFQTTLARKSRKSIYPLYSMTEFLDWWNTYLFFTNIWQRFSCLLDKGIAIEIETSQWPLSYLLDRTANLAHGCKFWTCLGLPQKATVGIRSGGNYFSFPNEIYMLEIIFRGIPVLHIETHCVGKHLILNLM